MQAYCPTCGVDRTMQITVRNESFPTRGTWVTVEAQVAICPTCGADVSVASLDDATLRSVYHRYRVEHGLLTSEDIVQIRRQYGWSQQQLADVLGWDPRTIARYEQGALQSVAHDQQLRSLRNPDAISQALTQLEQAMNSLLIHYDDIADRTRHFDVIKDLAQRLKNAMDSDQFPYERRICVLFHDSIHKAQAETVTKAQAEGWTDILHVLIQGECDRDTWLTLSKQLRTSGLSWIIGDDE